MFCDPVSSASIEKISYQVPTYEAINGICRNVYFKPTFRWVIDKVRVMNPIRIENKGVILPKYDKKYTNSKFSDLASYAYLKDVRYQVLCHFEWNDHYPEYEQDRDYKKHIEIAKRAFKSGGRRNIFLGASDCPGYVRYLNVDSFGEGEGAYDNSGAVSLGVMYHSTIYPDLAFSPETEGMLSVAFDNIIMNNGVITFSPQSECRLIKPIRKMSKHVFQQEGDRK